MSLVLRAVLPAVFLISMSAAAPAQNWAQECAQYRCASTARSLDQCITCNMSVGPWTREQSVQWCNRWMSRCGAPGARK
jgi:hypothetical protein